MKNTWLDEIKVRNTAESISKSLALTFIGTQTEIDDWAKHAFDMMRGAEPRIRDSLMWKYIFQYEIDEQAHVQSLEFVRLPWLV